MAKRIGNAEWNGNLLEGRGTLSLGSGAFQGNYSFTSRFEEGPGTNPEELIGAAHAGCFSMAFAGQLADAGFKPQTIRTTARVSIEKSDGGFSITRSELSTEAVVPEIDDATFQRIAQEAKAGCPVSRALAAIEITLDAKLMEA